MANCSELKARQVSVTEELLQTMNSQGSKPSKILNPALVSWKFFTYF